MVDNRLVFMLLTLLKREEKISKGKNKRDEFSREVFGDQ